MHKQDFQIFNNYINAKDNAGHLPMVYLDTAASSLTPDYVVKKMNEYYFDYRSNIDRGLYTSATRATFEYEESRKKIAKFINANDDEVIFTSSSTDSSNKLVMMLESYLKETGVINKKGDTEGVTLERKEILVSTYSHHSDLVPLQKLAQNNNLNIILCTDEQDFINKISPNTILISCVHASNVTGQIFDVKSIFAKVREISKNIFTICDMTASVGHINVDVKDIDCDAAYFGAHKMCGPTGVGALYIKREIMRNMFPATFGGGMVSEVLDDVSTYRSDIKRFEAGTGNIAGVIGFGAAVDYINNLGKENDRKEVEENKSGLEIIRNHTKEILDYALSELSKLEESGLIKLFTERNTENNIGIISFEVYKKNKDLNNLNSDLDVNIKTRLVIHPHDVAQILADNHVAVRSGHHCAAPLMRKLNVTALTRASFYFYNTKDDVDALIINLKKVQDIFSK